MSDAELARLRAELEAVRALLAQQERATEAERAARTRRESQLGQAHSEIARLTEALHQVARMKTITGARRIVADALEGEVSERSPDRRRSRL